MLVHAALLFISAVSAHPTVPKYDYDQRERRGMTWSNFMPGGGMTLWSAANDDFWAPEPERRLLPPVPSDGEFWATDPKENETPRKDEGPVKGDEAPTGHEAPSVRPFDDDRERRPLKPSYRPKKGYRDQEDDDRRYSGSNASVNAWFPIMLGVLPQDAKTKQNDAGSSGSSGSPGSSGQVSDEYGQTRSITAIANSVNHAARGLANAHTVLYAGDPPSSYRRARSLVVF